jgi:TetR/AcrR family transcriptional regulator
MLKRKVTANKILDSAEEEFLAKGFSGASINTIADHADIHKSLIYHHYKSKEGLWKAVKSRVLSVHNEKNPVSEDLFRGTFQEFLTTFINHRFDFYNKNPEVARIIAWQRLEEKREDLETNFGPLRTQIEEFQRQGRIRTDLDPEMIEYLILNITTLPFMAKSKLFERKNKKQNKEIYVKWVIETLTNSIEGD